MLESENIADELYAAKEPDAVLADYPIQANAETGGNFAVDGYDTIFAWMNAQSK